MKTIILIIVSMLLASMVYGAGQIDIAYSPYTITRSGSYILVKDLYMTTTAADYGIWVQASTVTIDLNGHTLYGPNTTSPIYGIGAWYNLTIKNGSIENFGYWGIASGNGDNAKISNVRVAHCGGGGGGSAGGIIIGGDAVIDNCVVRENYGYGIEGYYHNRITNCFVYMNTGRGIQTNDFCDIIGNTVNQNGQEGMYIYNSCSIKDNTVSKNAFDGIKCQDDNLIQNNHCDQNFGNGITVNNNNRIRDNVCFHNGSWAGGTLGCGISAAGDSMIENNNLYVNDTQLLITGTGCYFGGNKLYYQNSVVTTYSNATGIYGNVNIIYY